MKQNEPTPALNSTDERVMQALHAHQRRLKWLTAVAIAFWSLAVIASVGVLLFFTVFYAPKEKQILKDYGTAGHLVARTNSPAGSQETGRMDTDHALGVHFMMTWVMTRGILATAISVIVLSCGTLTTLLLVILNRRVTLKQINYSLAQISEQLKELKANRA
jgi:hypothetical protein